MFGGEDDESDEGSVTEVEPISEVAVIGVGDAEDDGKEAEESDGGVEDASEAAAELMGVEVGEDIAALLVEGPVPLGTI